MELQHRVVLLRTRPMVLFFWVSSIFNEVVHSLNNPIIQGWCWFYGIDYIWSLPITSWYAVMSFCSFRNSCEQHLILGYARVNPFQFLGIFNLVTELLMSPVHQAEKWAASIVCGLRVFSVVLQRTDHKKFQLRRLRERREWPAIWNQT